MFGIEHHIVLVEVRIAYVTMVVEQIDSSLMKFILGVLESMVTQGGVDIFFPKSRPIK